jgi:hypothetical protein
LAGGNTQQQSFGACAVAAQVDQGRANDKLAQLARGDTHNALELEFGRRTLELGSWRVGQARRKQPMPLELKCSVIFVL